MPKKILVVDDDQDIVYLLQTTLEKSGYEVITASDGNQALKVLKTNVPDLMIVDLTMPGMSGWHFNMTVRMDERYKKTPIIILSALLDKDVLENNTQEAITYIPKPFDIFEVVDKVKELLSPPT